MSPGQPGADRVILRRRLLDQLAPMRGELILVVAGPGMGKSTLLTQLSDERRSAGCVYGLWIDGRGRFEIGDAAGSRQDFEGPDLVNHLWNRAPDVITLVVDDAHDLDDRGQRILLQLLETLPGNVGMVVASRSPLSKIATAGAVRRSGLRCVTEEDLVFDDSEVRELAGDVGADRAGSLRWPARAMLALYVGTEVADEYVWNEVLARLAPAERRFLAVAALIGDADTDMLRAWAAGVDDVRTLLHAVPLVREWPAGHWHVHALWSQALKGELDPTTRSAVHRDLAARALDDGNVDRAIEQLGLAGDWEQALELAIDLAADHTLELVPDQVSRWAVNLPATSRRRPEARLLSAVEMMSVDTDRSYELLIALLDEFAAAGSMRGQLAALRQLTRIAVWREDPTRLLPLVDRVAAMVDAGHHEFLHLHLLNQALIASVLGDAEKVLELLDEEMIQGARAFEPVLRWLRGFALLDRGDPVRARHEGERGLELVGDRGFRLPLHALAIEAVFEIEGDTAALEQLEEIMPEVEGTGLDAFVGAAAVRLVAAHAFVGHPEVARSVRERYARQLADLESPPLQVLRALADALIDVAGGRDEAARAILLDAAERHPVADPIAQGPWSRHTAVVAVLLHDHPMDAWADSDFRARGRRLAAALRKAREGDADPTVDLEPHDVAVVRSHLPRRWIAELAHLAPRDIAEALVRELGTEAAEHLRAVAPPNTSSPAVRLAPAAPGTPLEIRLLGDFEVRSGGEAILDARLARQRVREMLALLVHHGGAIDRGAIAARMWPNKPRAAGARNLRVNLSHLIGALEPTREPGAPSFFVRQVGTRLELSGDLLTIDVHEFDRALREAHAAERSRQTDRAVDLYRRGLRWWRGQPGVYDDVRWAPDEGERLRSTFVTGAVRLGDLLVAAGQHEEAAELAQRAIEAQPWSLEPIRVAVSAARSMGRTDASLLARADAIARELGVDAPPWLTSGS